MGDVTRILNAIDQGDPPAADQLLPLVYAELRKLAAAKLNQEQPGQTLQATALVHEAYLRLAGAGQAQHWNSRGHFFGAAAKAMRRILIEVARKKKAEKRGGEWNRISLDDAGPLFDASADDVLRLNEALQELSQEDALAARLVELRYFAGLSVEEAAETVGISTATAYRHWSFARVWLHCQIGQSQEF